MIDNTLFYGKVNNAINKGNRKREKLFTLTMIMLFLSLGAIANPVEIGKARQVATTFLNNNGARSAGLTEVAVSAGFSNVYVFTTENSFVLMAADDRVQPILGYSLTGRFNVEDMPANKRAWIQEYSDAIRYAIDNQLRASSEVTQQWRDLAEGNPNVDRATTVVAPLIQTHWSQGSPYNMLCPGGSVTGCVATAMAQIMKYWNYPEHGIGSHTYTHSTYGELSADFQSTTYDWNNMINTYDYSSTNTQKMAVATLMYHCGVSVNMNYSPSSSSAGSAIVAEALKTYFNYSTEMAYHARSEYSDNVWISMLKADLNLNRPIWYNGRGSGGGHAFVFDGYNSNNYFHVNWGWGGYCDEYYVISNLNPGPGGIGSGDNGIYNEDQGAVLGIRPSECTADAPSNLTYSQNGRNVSLSWTAASGASSYQVYCNNSFIGNVSSTSYTGIAPYGSSVYYVRSVDSQGRLSLSSNAVTVTVDYPVPLVDDLAATASGNNVNLSWTAPDWCYPSTPTATLTYGEGNYNGSLGYTGSNTIYWGHRYLASNLSSYNNMKVYKVSFFANETGPYEVYVYNGTTSGHPQTQLLQQSFSVGSTGWFDIDLSTPIQIDASQDLWVFIYDPEYRNYPATYCSYYSGSEGNYYSTNPTSGVYTWNNAAFLIRTFVSDGNYTYNIFRNSFCIANNVGSTSYYDNNLPTGFYNYYVTTNYYAGETSASNQVSVQIGTGTYYTISASANPIEGGTVIGMGSFIAGQTCTLIASANEGYSFVDWTKNGTSVSTDATYSFAVTENATYVANFSSNTPQGLEVFAEYYPEANNPNSQYVRVYWTESSRFYLDNDNVDSGTSKSDRSTYCVYRAYCDGSGEELIANNVTGNQYIDNEWSGLATGNYKYGVSVVDGRGNAKEIHWNDTPVIPNPHTLDVSAFQPPVTNNSHYGELRVNCENGRHNNDVTISTGVKDNRDYLQYCTDNYAGGVGTGGGAVYWGIRFPAADLTAYAGQSLTKVGIFTDTDGDYGWTYSGYYTVNVYLGGATAPGTLVSTISEYVPGDFAWHDITLTTPVTIDATQDLWLTIYTSDIAYPMSGCDYVGNGNSDFLSLDGFTWEHSTDYGLNYTWMIRGCVGEGGSTEITWSNCIQKSNNTYSITAMANSAQGGTVSGGGTYIYGQNCTLVAIANPGYTFTDWTKDGMVVSTTSTYSFTVTENATYIANFSESQGEITQTTDLAQGWNWWSTYVEQDGIDGLAMLEESLGTNGYQIKSQTDFVTNYGSMWFGMLSSITNEETYMIDNTTSCQIEMTGAPVTPSDHPITVSSGWNWIGYPCTNTMSVSEAFAGYTPANGDQVKSQADYAMYFSGMWIGQLQSITPGTGLMYLSNNTTSTTLVYPDGGRSTEIPTLPKATHWTNDIHAYPHNMTVMAVVELDDVELTTDNYELAAFDANGECRGSAKLTYVEPLNRYVAFLTIAGNDAVELGFRLYDAETGAEYYDAEESLSFAVNATIGEPEDVFVVHFRGTTGMDELASSVQVYPNPVNGGEQFSIGVNAESKAPVRVEIVNAMGVETLRATSTQMPAMLTAPSVAGVYTMRITVEGKGTVVRKLVVK